MCMTESMRELPCELIGLRPSRLSTQMHVKITAVYLTQLSVALVSESKFLKFIKKMGLWVMNVT